MNALVNDKSGVGARWGIRRATAQGGGGLLWQSWRRHWRGAGQWRGLLRYTFHSLRWLRQQIEWLHALESSHGLRQAAEIDARLYERWHRPHISRGFSPATRRAVVHAHYAFLAHGLSERLRTRLLQGHDVRVATLRLRDGELAYLHLRKPARQVEGELGLFLLNAERQVVSSCALTFAGEQGLWIGALRGSWAFMGKQAIRRFTRASDGLRPKDLLLSMIRALAAQHGYRRIRAVAEAFRPLAADGASQDGFWAEHGRYLAAEGCYELDLDEPERALTSYPSKRRAALRRREWIRQAARTALLEACRERRIPRAGRAVDQSVTARARVLGGTMLFDQKS